MPQTLGIWTASLTKARTHATPSIERSVLLRMGFSSIECRQLVTQMQAHGLNGQGAGRLVLELARAKGISVRETGLASAPNAVQILDTDRGLLGTHAVCSISNNLHFGIFDDGWWFLDSSGRWKEAGVTQFNGRPVEKWRRTFGAARPSRTTRTSHGHAAFSGSLGCARRAGAVGWGHAPAAGRHWSDTSEEAFVP